MQGVHAHEYMDLREERKSGKIRGRGRNMKANLCIPRLRSNRVSPVSLLERFRAVVFRLIMLSAISKGTQHGGPCSGGPRAYPPDSHYSEAVADCIEFIKKSASDDGARDSAASVSSVETPLPALPVM